MCPTDPVLYSAFAADIDQAIAGVCRKRCLRGADADDFAQNIRVRLLEDAATLLTLDGKREVKAYLFRVIDNKFLDWSRQCDGRWRPSAAARREGRLAIEFEALVERDGLTLSEAVETIHGKRGVAYGDLETLRLRLPSPSITRAKLRLRSLGVDGGAARSERAFAVQPEDLQAERDNARMVDRVQTSLDLAWAELAPDQRRILVDHFGIGRARTPANAHDRGRARLRLALGALRELLASCGIGWPEVRRALVSGEIEMRLVEPPNLERAAEEGRPNQASKGA